MHSPLSSAPERLPWIARGWSAVLHYSQLIRAAAPCTAQWLEERASSVAALKGVGVMCAGGRGAGGGAPAAWSQQEGGGSGCKQEGARAATQ